MIDSVTAFGSALLGGAWPVAWSLIKIVALVLPLMICVAYLTLWERKAIGWTQIRPGPNRVGPLGLLQPIADAVKLLFKEIIVPTAANKGLFFLGPVMTIMPALAAWAVVPFGPEVALANINAGLLFLMAITSMEVYGVIIAGWASNSKYAFLGALRASAQMVSYEIAMGFCAGRRADGRRQPEHDRDRAGPGPRHVRRQGPDLPVAGTGCRCCRSSSSTSSPAWPRPTATRSTWSKANRRSSPATWSSTRAWRSRCSSSPNTPT